MLHAVKSGMATFVSLLATHHSIFECMSIAIVINSLITMQEKVTDSVVDVCANREHCYKLMSSGELLISSDFKHFTKIDMPSKISSVCRLSINASILTVLKISMSSSGTVFAIDEANKVFIRQIVKEVRSSRFLRPSSLSFLSFI
jgi:hypothetical protein